MARRRGGYQRPSNPAGASGPGAMSQRTDGRVPNIPRTGLAYGENKAVNEQASAAPLTPAQGPSGAGSPVPRPARSPDGVFSPTDRPQEPMTSGVPFGPGSDGPMLPPLDDDPSYEVRATAIELAKTRPDLAEYIVSMLDA